MSSRDVSYLMPHQKEKKTCQSSVEKGASVATALKHRSSELPTVCCSYNAQTWRCSASSQWPIIENGHFMVNRTSILHTQSEPSFHTSTQLKLAKPKLPKLPNHSQFLTDPILHHNHKQPRTRILIYRFVFYFPHPIIQP